MVFIRISKNGKRIRAEISGHANYSKKGTDIVCAAVSILTGTLAQHVQKMAVQGKIAQLNDFVYGPDRVCVEFMEADTPESRMATDTMVEVIITGYEMVAEMHPNHVQMALNY